MKFLLAMTLALGSVIHSAGAQGNAVCPATAAACSDCITCDGMEQQCDGTYKVSFKHCKTDSFSWFCCISVNGAACGAISGATCSGGNTGLTAFGTLGGNKCENVPSGASPYMVSGLQSITDEVILNTHDGQTLGGQHWYNPRPDELELAIGDGNGANICAGAEQQGGACGKDLGTSFFRAGRSTHCLLSFIPEDDCPALTVKQRCDPTTTDPVSSTTTTTTTITTAVDPTTTTATPGSFGDPHFQTFGFGGNTFFDFHGGCDLVLGNMPSFAKGLGLLVQLRTTTRYDYSFIESVAIKIGEDILEISSFGQYMINGISNAAAPFMMSAFPVIITQPRDKQQRFTIELGDNISITVKVFKDLVYVSMDVTKGSDADFSDTVGLMGSWKTGARLARDGVTILEDPIEFGQEWQVQIEASLFMTARAPQYPAKCEMPDPVERSSRRRLGESISAKAAGIACAHVKGDHAHDMCVFDVIATNDLTVGQGGAY